MLDQGLGLYPFDPALRLATAQAYSRCGYAAEAEAQIARGLAFVDDETAKQLTALRNAASP